MDIPANLEARRRISFFATSLFTDMPVAPNVRNMLSFRLSSWFLPSAYVHDSFPASLLAKALSVCLLIFHHLYLDQAFKFLCHLMIYVEYLGGLRLALQHY